MAKTVEKTKLVTVSNKGPIDELGGISGPIINPCKLPESIVIKMVTNRKKVYEVNPNNTDEKVLLTISNVRKENFPKKIKNVVEKVSVKSAPVTKTTTDKIATETKTEATSDFTKK